MVVMWYGTWNPSLLNSSSEHSADLSQQIIDQREERRIPWSWRKSSGCMQTGLLEWICDHTSSSLNSKSGATIDMICMDFPAFFLVGEGAWNPLLLSSESVSHLTWKIELKCAGSRNRWRSQGRKWAAEENIEPDGKELPVSPSTVFRHPPMRDSWWTVH